MFLSPLRLPWPDLVSLPLCAVSLDRAGAAHEKGNTDALAAYPSIESAELLPEWCATPSSDSFRVFYSCVSTLPAWFVFALASCGDTGTLPWPNPILISTVKFAPAKARPAGAVPESAAGRANQERNADARAIGIDAGG